MLSTPLPTATLRRTLFRVSAITALICRPTGMWCLSALPTPISEDTNQRVAADGFSKIPAMIAPTLQECYQRGVRPEATAMLPALFFVFMEQWHKGTLPYQYRGRHPWMRRRCMRCSRLRIRWLSSPVIKPCLVISPTTRISPALMREKVAAVYTLIN